mmetsp:Transcript_109286/g.308932  ORF Transcript_109286/g.308932 Transcript_109286/m.308932 type:complete len:322 (+) Transcript_109286:487-1452(+)
MLGPSKLPCCADCAAVPGVRPGRHAGEHARALCQRGVHLPHQAPAPAQHAAQGDRGGPPGERLVHHAHDAAPVDEEGVDVQGPVAPEEAVQRHGEPAHQGLRGNQDCGLEVGAGHRVRDLARLCELRAPMHRGGGRSDAALVRAAEGAQPEGSRGPGRSQERRQSGAGRREGGGQRRGQGRRGGGHHGAAGAKQQGLQGAADVLGLRRVEELRGRPKGHLREDAGQGQQALQQAARAAFCRGRGWRAAAQRLLPEGDPEHWRLEGLPEIQPLFYHLPVPRLQPQARVQPQVHVGRERPAPGGQGNPRGSQVFAHGRHGLPR